MITSTVAPSLPSDTPSSACPVPDDSLRAGRFAARHWIWDNSTATRGKVDVDGHAPSLPARHRLCGRVVQGNGAPVVLRVSTGDDGQARAGWGGVQSCGSPWSCPYCSAKIAHGRQQEIASALTAWSKLYPGGDVALLTLTMRHRRGQSLRTLWDALVGAWRRVTTGRAWVEAQTLAGVECERVVKSGKMKGQTVLAHRVHWIKATEVTVSYDNGWHVHLHVLVFLRPGVSTDAQTKLFAGVWQRWRDALTDAGLAAPSGRYGFDIRDVDLSDGGAAALGDYFTKAVYRASSEVARGDLKAGRGGGRTPMQVLRDLVVLDSGEVIGDRDVAALDALDRGEDFAIWSEWERISAGRRQIAWSGGLRELLALGVELTDDQLAEDDSAAGEVALQVEAAVFSSICAARQDYLLLRLWVTDRRLALVILGRHEDSVDARRDDIGQGRARWRER